MEFRLRSYNENDADTILSWISDERDFYKWSAGILGDYPISREQFGFVNNLMAFTAVNDDELIGFFTMRRPTENFDELRFGFIVVDPEKRGNGYGKGMLQLGIKYAQEIIGAKKISLGVFENNESAYYCYKSVGFKDTVLDETEIYTVLGEEWKCLELEIIL
ncbi:GNAT family protein [Peptostreptococcus porci]|uniref:GNAT family N-acetyltransferase n=1 Tax=Peptostreptococcus porci TaxID=2652282 RepID=UPI002A913CDE|nr:GNAT family protein [Peptostreptococcus porci]MDY6232600.1 GNAT family protein [Peptostreptococcus porci]